jgi:hypothetical protein
MIVTLLAAIAMTPYSAIVRVPIGAPATGKPVEVLIVRPGFDWNEAIVSWNVTNPERARFKVEAQVKEIWYVLADWSGDMTKGPRASVPNQKNEEGEVQTDVLHLKKPADSLSLRITMNQATEGAVPQVKLLTVCFSNTDVKPTEDDGPLKVGKILETPQKAQGPYEFGKLSYKPEKVSPAFESWFKTVKGAQYCSPASVCMALGYWAQKLDRQDLAVDMPEVVAGVFDEKYPGTGNWPFNAAYAGSFDGMRSYVTRLRGIRDLEALIDAGVPVICSVAHNLLLGNGKPAGGDGHLVVLIGFDASGDPVFNDPGKTDQVRRTYKRADFRKAWDNSGRTVYICHPEGMKLPRLSEQSVVRD